MKNNPRIIVLMIILTVLAIGLTYVMINFIRGGQGFNFVFNFGNSEEINSDPLFVKEYELGEIENIKVKYDCGNIYIKESSNSNIKLELYGDEEKDTFEVNTVDKVLDVNYKINSKTRWFSIDNKIRKVVVYLPTNYENTLILDNDAGNINISDFENVSLDIKCDAGDVHVGKVKNAKINCDAGDIKVAEILNKCDITCDAGNVEIQKVSIKEDSKLTCDFGNIKINDAKGVHIDAKCDFGNCKVENNDKESDVTLKIYCDCGNVTVK